MKEQIQKKDVERFKRDGTIFGILFLAVAITPIPLVHFLNFIGIAIWVLLFVVAMCYALQIEKQKKSLDIQTYKEILAFSEGKRLDEIEKQQEYGKRPYQKVLLAMGSGLFAMIVSGVMLFLLL